MRSFILVALLCAASAASAQLYRWTDERGRVHVTDTPPPPTAKNVQRRSSGAGPASGGGDLPYSVQRAAQNYPVTLFTAPDCAPCGPARALLNARGVPFREVLVVDEKQAEELRKAVGTLSVPSLRVGSIVQKGFEASAYQSLLDTAGYPRTGILPARNQAEPTAAAKPAATPAAEAGASEDVSETPGPYAPR
jgi:glutaredoxin